MAKTGVLAKKTISGGAAGRDVIVYRVPTETAATVTVSVSQKANSTAEMDLALLDPGEVSINGDDVILFDHLINYRQEFEKKGIVLGSQQAIAVNFTASGATVIVWGFEDVD